MGNLTDHFSGGEGTNVLEYISAPADGRTVTTTQGDITFQNVTASQSISSTSLVDITGSSISYTPPEGTKYVKYCYSFKIDVTANSGISNYRLYVDDVEVVDAHKQYASNYASTNWNHAGLPGVVEFTFDLTAYADTVAEGQFNGWTSDKTIKVKARAHSSSYTVNLNSNVYNAAGSVPKPNLTIVAFK